MPVVFPALCGGPTGGEQMKSRQRYGESAEARIVAACALGRPLPPGAVVHHVSGDRNDNRPGNLVICPDREYHRELHCRQIGLVRNVGIIRGRWRTLLADTLYRAVHCGEHVPVTAGGQPVAVVMSLAEYRRLVSMAAA